MFTISGRRLIIYASLFLTLFYNYSFFTNVLVIYPLELKNIGFLISLVIVLIFFNILFFTLISSRYTVKAILIITFLVSSLTSYFMNTYHVVIDDSMIRNMLQTNINESIDLFSFKQVLYFLIFGVLPSVLIYKSNLKYKTMRKEFISKAKIITISLIVIVACFLSFSKHYTSFLREHKPLRYSVNPTYWMYSVGKYMNLTFRNGEVTLASTGGDAKVIHIDAQEENENELIILVVGEAARADHFSLNGYAKQTNPLVSKENIINFSNMYSCGTSTAESVPCMFSIFDKSNYSYKKGVSTENVLDVLSHTDYVNILWRDNNSDSKGVALRVPFEDYRDPKNNTICIDGECRDEGMLVGLDEYIEKNKGEDILIILHQMGNHGPAYYKRYPKSFEKFTPVCQTNQLEECSKEEISNAYDNAILYTDYFLSKTINFLKKYDKTHEVGMIYMSDHGESLGENGIYLHGLPYFMAPDAQTHIASFIWFGEKLSEDINIEKVKENSDKEFSQDNLFHTLLGLFEVQSKVYKKEMDIVYDNK